MMHPVAVKLKLLPRRLEFNENPEVLEAPYNAASKIYFRLEALNASSEQVSIMILDQYVQIGQNCGEMEESFRTGSGLDKFLQAKENDPYTNRVQVVTLAPNEQRLIAYYIELSDWYGCIKAGHYRLLVRHRFELGQDWSQSSPITFEVEIKERRRSIPIVC